MRTIGCTLLAVCLLAACTLACRAPRAALPELEAGARSSTHDPDSLVVAPGLAAPVRIVTDRHGIPHLDAASLSDLYFAWGYVTARDRLWQIAHARQSARGELWRWVGNRALQGDGGAQLFRLRERAAAVWARDRAVPEVRLALERFAAGVNARLALHRRGAAPWPAELRALGAVPEEWRPEDAILIEMAQAFVLDFALPELDEAREPAGAAARERFEVALMRTTIPDSISARSAGAAAAARRSVAGDAPGAALGASHGTRTTLAPAATLAADLRAARRALVALGLRTPDPDERASNIFAVGPARSASRMPILANDPHLPLTDPGTLWMIHVRVSGVVDAAGATVPGLPLIVSGRNRECAWGLTALSADVIDVYADSLSRDGKRIHSGGRWVDVVEAPFAMRFRLPGGLEIPVPGQLRRYGPHGPIVALNKKRGVALGVRWAGEDSAITMRGLIGLERSRSAAEVAEAVRTVVTPTLNIVAADVGGHVVYQACGAVPRRGYPALRGPTPADGRHEWRGLIPPDEMPAWNVPPGGFVVNANNLPVAEGRPDDWPRFDWAHDRAARMQDRLAALPRVTLSDAAAIQNDVWSGDAARMLPRLLRCADSVATRLGAEERAALDLLRAWDYTTTRDRVGPTLYQAWYGALHRRSALRGLHGLAAAALDGRAPEALRHPRTGAPERAAEAAVAALRIGLGRLRTLFGPDPTKWTWGEAHRARFAHALAFMDPRLQVAPEPFDGDRSTPSVGRSRMPWNVACTHAPVFRHLVDLAVAESSLAIVPPGNSGVRGAAHATDLLSLWADHRYVTLHLDWPSIEAISESETRLVPPR